MSLAPSQVDRFKKILFYSDRYTCLTAYSKRNAATFAHGEHESFAVGQLFNITSVANALLSFQVKVIELDRHKNVMIVEADVDLIVEVPAIVLPYIGASYAQLGFAALTQFNTPFSVRTGVISSVEVDKHGQIRGSIDAKHGESGGPILAIEGFQLYGINVGSELMITGDTPLKQLGSDPPFAHIVPSILFVK